MIGAFIKGQGNVLIPVDPNAEAFVRSMKAGDGAYLDAKKARNLGFHRKFFKLLGLAFDIWEPSADNTHKGEIIVKNPDKFREDILILAGHSEIVYAVDGSLRVVAKSISFANCDEIEFEPVYRSVLTVVWEKILRLAKFKDQAEVDCIVGQLMGFEG